MTTSPPLCKFDNPGFASLGTLLFRLTNGDGVAALVMRLDNSDVVVPLHAVARLFNIESTSPDGRMLHLIEQGLRFVSILRLGDPLPTEVLTGEASWQPTAYHQQIASARLQLQLLNWIGGAAYAGGERVDMQALIASIEDPAIRPRVQEALRKASGELGIEGGGPAVARLVEELAGELAFIEALRERLLERVRTMIKRLGRTGASDGALSGSRRETLFQVTRLAMAGFAQITGRFEEVDAQTGEILPALRNLEHQRTFLRPHRDWLYCVQLAWEPLLKAWDTLPAHCASEAVWKVIEEAYRFLAPRYMARQEWQQVAATLTRNDREKTTVLW